MRNKTDSKAESNVSPLDKEAVLMRSLDDQKNIAARQARGNLSLSRGWYKTQNEIDSEREHILSIKSLLFK